MTKEKIKEKKWKKKQIWGVYEKNCSDINFCSLIGIFEFQSWADLICSYLNACQKPKKCFLIKKLKFEEIK